MPGYLSRTVEREVAMPASGEGFDERRDPRFKAAQETVEKLTFFADALKEHFDAAERYWRLYLLQRKDNLRPWEYWRNKVVTAHPNTTIEVSTASLVSQVLSHIPPIMPESQQVTDPLLEARLTKWWGYTLRKNKFERELELFIREMLIQSIAIRKNALVERSREIIHFPSDAAAQEFDSELDAVVTQFGIEPPVPEQFGSVGEFQKAFEGFRRAVNAATGSRVPEFPIAGPRKITLYKGPGWKRISMFNFFYDPTVPIDDQEDMILASVVDESWVRRRATPDDPNAPFDAEMVEYCLKGNDSARTDIWDGQGRNQWESRLARVLNSAAAQDDKPHPSRKKPAFLIEHYSPGSKIPYRVVLNGRGCINKRKSNPWEHGDFPFTIATNVNVPFISSGISDMMAAESLFRETNKLRGLTLDGVSLSVLPVFARMKDAGLTDIAKFIVPGSILDTVRSRGALEQVSKISPPDTRAHLADLRSEIEDATGTYPQSRGAPGPSGITATQTERAFAGMAARNQIKLHRIEADLSTMPPQWMSIAHQFLDDDSISSLSRQLIKDSTIGYSLEDFHQGIGMDWAFRSSRLVANKELKVANLKDLFTLAVNAFAMMPAKPISLERLFMAIVQQVDPEIAESIKTTPEEQAEAAMAAQAEAEAGGAPPETA